MVAQQADHNLGGFLCPWVGEGMLLGRQILVRTSPGADERWSQQRRSHGIHQAKSHRLNEPVGVVKGAQWRPIKVPLFTAKLVKVDHKTVVSFQLSAISKPSSG
jgi:hypothetical protein